MKSIKLMDLIFIIYYYFSIVHEILGKTKKLWKSILQFVAPVICFTEAPAAAESKKKSIGKAGEKPKEEKQKKASVKGEGDKRGSKASAPLEEVSTLTIQYSSLKW